MGISERAPWVVVALLGPLILFITDLPLSSKLLVALPLCALTVVTLVGSSQGQATEDSSLGRHADTASRISILLLLTGIASFALGMSAGSTAALIIASSLIWSGATLRMRLQEVQRRAMP